MLNARFMAAAITAVGCIGTTPRIADADTLDQDNTTANSGGAGSVAVNFTRSQTVTVGISGVLSRIGLQVNRTTGTTEVLQVRLLGVVSGEPDTSDVLATRVIQPSEVPEGDAIGATPITFVDFLQGCLSFGAGDMFAIELTSNAPNIFPHPKRYLWAVEGPYPDGQAFTNGVANTNDRAFQTFMVPAADLADCNSNNVPDACDIANGTSEDCNNNGIPDDCDIAANTSFDCNCNGVPDECDILNGLDVNGDGFVDSCVLCAGDTNCDGIVNYVDMMNVWANLGTSGPTGDVNYDGTVNILDYFIVAWNYGSVCN